MAGSPRQISRSQISYIRDLIQSRRTRDREGVFVLEGAKPILELLQSAPHHVVTVVASPGFLDRQSPAVKQQLLRRDGAFYLCCDERLAKISAVETSSGAVAIVRRPTWDQSAVLARPRVLGLYGDRLQDPTNIGAIIRTAAGLDVSGLWLAPDSVDVFNPKVVRATAGTLFRFPIFFRTAIEELVEQGCVVFAADTATGGLPIRSIQTLPPRTIVAIGSEGRGLSDATMAAAQFRFTIPLKQDVESLNVAAAAAIAMFHLSGLPIAHSFAS
ncbi:MAG: hypothetical protein OJF52_002233 [Nitrospira sp.]|nr:MAG: hypothetical protein OJF52_002233 [Nitrospira sp.]